MPLTVPEAGLAKSKPRTWSVRSSRTKPGPSTSDAGTISGRDGNFAVFASCLTEHGDDICLRGPPDRMTIQSVEPLTS
jgi:hypothetical protein